ncbi:hypothetical protein BJ741DRAFT_19226 [Chytriomyces cf. hyalinus JEL632]|nr:hypothetical protein BJ741DRAFT_19226 [Chytriomyces cf. hyalinus JEL632]
MGEGTQVVNWVALPYPISLLSPVFVGYNVLAMWLLGIRRSGFSRNDGIRPGMIQRVGDRSRSPWPVYERCQSEPLPPMPSTPCSHASHLFRRDHLIQCRVTHFCCVRIFSRIEQIRYKHSKPAAMTASAPFSAMSSSGKCPCFCLNRQLQELVTLYLLRSSGACDTSNGQMLLCRPQVFHHCSHASAHAPSITVLSISVMGLFNTGWFWNDPRPSPGLSSTRGTS